MCQIKDIIRWEMSNGSEKSQKSPFKRTQESAKLTLSPALRKAVQGEQWKLGDREYRDLDCDVFFSSLEQAEPVVLWLDLNKKSTILKQILAPTYPRLQALYLGDNNIASLESLVLLQAPLLLKLYLNHNKITSLRSLPRATFPLLAQLNFSTFLPYSYGNLIEEEHYISYCHFPNLQKMSLSYPNKKQRIFEQKWFVKADIKPEAVIISGKSRIGTFTRKMYLSYMSELTPIEPKNLFKTFEG